MRSLTNGILTPTMEMNSSPYGIQVHFLPTMSTFINNLKSLMPMHLINKIIVRHHVRIFKNYSSDKNGWGKLSKALLIFIEEALRRTQGILAILY